MDTNPPGRFLWLTGPLLQWALWQPPRPRKSKRQGLGQEQELW